MYEMKYYDSENFICIVKVWRWIEEVNFALYILKVDSLGSPIHSRSETPFFAPWARNPVLIVSEVRLSWFSFPLLSLKEKLYFAEQLAAVAIQAINQS